MSAALSDTVSKEPGRLFSEADAAEVCELLAAYGQGPGEREVERVQMDILRLCKRRVDKVRELVKTAKGDYRDVLTWAEYQRFRVYVVWLLRKGPNWPARPDRALMQAHTEAVKNMKQSGKLLIGGPLKDEEGGWMYLFLTDTLEEARELVEADPAIQSGHFSYTLRPWMAIEGLRVVPLKDLPY